MSQITPFKEALLKRLAQFSTVIIFNSSDPKRLEPFLKFMYSRFSSVAQKSGKQPRIFLYKVWSGLYQVSVSGNEVSYQPVTMSMSAPSPLMSQLPSQRIRSLDAALQYLDSLMETEHYVIAVFWGLFSYGNISGQELYNFIKFLRNAIFDDRYYVAGHTIAVFTSTPETIFDDDTLKHSILINIPPSTIEERKQILTKIAEQMNLPIGNGELATLAEVTKGLNLHEVESVALESIFKYRRFDVKAMTAFKYDIVRKSGILDVEEPEHGFEAVGGYKAVKEFISTNIIKILKNPKRAEKLGLRPPRGILLFGPPGTGKTWFARALAKELNLPFLRLRTEKIVSKWYGETSRNIAKAIEIAEAVAPCVVFIDEIDRFGRRGHLTEHEESRRAFSILLEWLGDSRRKSIIIGTTNRPEDLDEAFRRVGRFDYLIPFLYPDYEARLEILKVHTSVVRKVPLRNVDLRKVASTTELWTGAELEELVLRSARLALKEDSDHVEMEHFMKALSTFRINYDHRRQQLEHYMKLAEEYTNDAEFLQQLKETMKKTRAQIALELMEE